MLSQRVARISEPGAHPGPPFTDPTNAMCVLHLQCCLPRAAKLGFAKSSAEHGQRRHGHSQQGLSLPKGRSKIWPWVVGATSAALLFGDSVARL